MESKRVVITGLGAITPIGNTVKDFWEGLVNGKNGAGEITRFDSTLFKTHFACEVKGYNPDDYFDKKTVRKYDLFAQFDLIAADEAILDSGISPENTDYDEVGVMITSGIGGVNHFYNEMMEYADSGRLPRFSPFLITKMIVNMPAGVVSIKYGFRGPNYATVSACASSAHSIIDAFDNIRFGKCDVVVAGGAGAAIGVCGIGGFNSMKALSTRNDDPLTASRPFDLNRDGFVMGEGAGCLVLEEENLCRNSGWWLIGRCLSHHRAASRRQGWHPEHATRPERRQLGSRSHRPHQHARHFHAGGRLGRTHRHQGSVWRTRLRHQHQFHQVDDRSPSWWRRRRGGHRQRAGTQARRYPAHHQPF